MDYQLIDCGNFYKIEQFGEYILARPEPQALWQLETPLDVWKSRADAYYERKRSDVVSNRDESGHWIFNKKIPDHWFLEIDSYGPYKIRVKLACTAFKHVGLFPEQKDNWNFIYSHCLNNKITGNCLNLFAYTGVASLVAASAGLKVVHVDSVKQVVNWANENRALSGLEPNISWVVEDAMKYLQREVTRGKSYSVIQLDPPAYGRGPSGEKWILEKELFEMLILCKKILQPKNAILILNVYSLHMTPLLVENLLKESRLWSEQTVIHEQYIPYRRDKKLPLGVTANCIY